MKQTLKLSCVAAINENSLPDFTPCANSLLRLFLRDCNMCLDFVSSLAQLRKISISDCGTTALPSLVASAATLDKVEFMGGSNSGTLVMNDLLSHTPREYAKINLEFGINIEFLTLNEYRPDSEIPLYHRYAEGEQEIAPVPSRVENTDGRPHKIAGWQRIDKSTCV